jgi:uncharacterized protein YndB with AHSA1/START domain
MDIDRTAPACARAETLIRAPLDLVWSVQTDIAAWPRWNKEVASVDLRGPVAPGTEFRWKSGGAAIVSVIQEVVPKTRIAWTGYTFGIRAAHVWSFESTADGVRATTEESFSGWPARLFPRLMKKMLATALTKGVDALRVECERRARAG